MTPLQRMTANQLAAALRDALPTGTFDERGFFAALDAVTQDTGANVAK